MTNVPLYYCNLKVPVDFIEFEEPEKDKWVERICDQDKINIEFREWLQSMKLAVVKCAFFSSPPGKKYRLHTDNNYVLDGISNVPKINLIFNSQDTYMEWYKAKLGFEQGDVDFNTLGRPVRYWKKEQCDLLLRTRCDTHCLVDGGSIHTAEVSPNNNGIRRCYSIILKDSSTGVWLDWADLVNRFDQYIVK